MKNGILQSKSDYYETGGTVYYFSENAVAKKRKRIKFDENIKKYF